MSALAKNGNRVLFVENTGVRSVMFKDLPRLTSRIKNWWRGGAKGIRKESGNLYILSPLLLPFPYSRVATSINNWLLRRALNRWSRPMGFSVSIVWTFLPTPLVLSILKDLSHRLLLYYCIDNFAESSRAAHRVKKYEEELLQACDLVFVTSHGQSSSTGGLRRAERKRLPGVRRNAPRSLDHNPITSNDLRKGAQGSGVCSGSAGPAVLPGMRGERSLFRV